MDTNIHTDTDDMHVVLFLAIIFMLLTPNFPLFFESQSNRPQF